MTALFVPRRKKKERGTSLQGKKTMEIDGHEPSMEEMDDNEGLFGGHLSNFIDKGSVVSRRYYLSRKTVMEMLRDRGYVVENSEIEQSLEEFRTKYTQDPDFTRLGISLSHKDDHSKKVQVLYCAPTPVNKKTIQDIIVIQVLNQGGTPNRLILIIQNQVTPPARKALELFPFPVETFQINELLVNVTKHVLQPQYEVLADEEKQMLLNKYGVEDQQLPWISKKDPIARYYGFEKGQVLKITCSHSLTDKHVTYRCVN